MCRQQYRRSTEAPTDNPQRNGSPSCAALHLNLWSDASFRLLSLDPAHSQFISYAVPPAVQCPNGMWQTDRQTSSQWFRLLAPNAQRTLAGRLAACSAGTDRGWWPSNYWITRTWQALGHPGALTSSVASVLCSALRRGYWYGLSDPKDRIQCAGVWDQGAEEAVWY